MNNPALQPNIENEKILIVDDDDTLRIVIKEALSTCDYFIDEASNVTAAKLLMENTEYDLVITDVVMPGETGVDLLRWAKETRLCSSFIIMTGHAEINAIADALNLGANFFLQKPFRPIAMIEAVSRIIENERLRKQNEKLRKELANYNEKLQIEVEEAKLENQKLFIATLVTLSNAIDARDKYTYAHSSSVAELSEALSKKMGMPKSFQEDARTAGQLHDIGKIAVPEHVLLKPSRLTDAEYALIQEHPTQGEKILQPIPSFERILPAIRHHHERYAGGGYPDNITGEDIPLLARIISVCDTWNAMRTNRPYRSTLPLNTAISIIKEECGQQFDPDIAETFLLMLEENEHFTYQ